MNTPQTWLPFNLNTCPQDVPILVWNKKTGIQLVEFNNDPRYFPCFNVVGANSCEQENEYEKSNLPTHYMPAPQPPMEYAMNFPQIFSFKSPEDEAIYRAAYDRFLKRLEVSSGHKLQSCPSVDTPRKAIAQDRSSTHIKKL